MTDILKTIADAAKSRIENAKRTVSEEEIRQAAYDMAKGEFLFEKALAKDGMSFICECKKASPSKGIIAEDFPYLDIAREYEAAGASAISVLTEPQWFMGSLEYLREIASEVKIPCLRKDFTVDPYMIYEAKLAGASAVLLICSILSAEELASYIGICDDLGLSALVEAHDADEVSRAIDCGARVIGVNNRNLKDFSVDPTNCLRLRRLIPDNVLFVAESGVKTAHDIRALYDNKVDAVLIGEAMMRSDNKSQFLRDLRSLL